MSARPPLPADLWDSLPSEVRAPILAQRAEVAELKEYVRTQHASVDETSWREQQPDEVLGHLKADGPPPLRQITLGKGSCQWTPSQPPHPVPPPSLNPSRAHS
jgi:hypothetical protein